MSVTAIALILIFIAVGAGLFAFVWWRFRTLLREAKNIERGLKMVPMLIQLPPSSEDIDGGGRDARDITEETIAKAQTLYDIIASTVESGRKSKFYGQRHISFEIVASHGFVKFYVAVPVALTSVVEQAVVSAYPTARLEQIPEHNIFNPVGRIAGTAGGEMVLKESYVNPIATFQENKRDAMQSLLNALSGLDADDGAAIQFLIRPAGSDWVDSAKSEVKSRTKDKGKKSGLSALFSMKDIAEAFWKPPEAKESKPDDQRLTNLEQSQVDSIETKTQHAAYETLIRVIASSNTANKAQGIVGNIVATFALFDAPGKNGFKYNAAHDIESFTTSFIMRFFPQDIRDNILNSVELATIFHFPDQKSTPTSQLERQASKQVDGPRNMPEDGTMLGYNVFRGVKKEVRLSEDDRRRHLYMVGQTGTGKSVLLENLAIQDLLSGKGFAFIDPHGDAADRIMSKIPKERTEDVIYFCPADMDFPMGLNLFEFHTPEQKDFLIQEAINMLYKLYDPQRQGIIGPRYEHWFRNAALTVMGDPAGSSFIDIPKVFTDKQFADDKLKHITDQTVLDFWNKEMAQTSDYHKSEVLGWFVSKFGAFMSNEMMRNIIGQTKSGFDLRDIMDNKKILIVNLSKGRTGELNSKLLGMIFIMKFQAAAMSRANIPESERVDFSLYVDEFQNFSTDSFATILSEARKYRLNLIVANQFITQLTEEIRDAVFGNVGSVVSLRAGATDADFLVKQFTPTFDADDIVRLPNYNAIVRLMINGVPSQPFSMATIPPLGHENAQLAQAMKQLSNAKYGRPKAVVEKEIFERLKTVDPPKPKFGQGLAGRNPGPPRAGQMGSAGANPFGAAGAPRRRPGSGGFGAAGAGAPGGARAGARPGAPGAAGSQQGGSSFLDDWLAKRKAAGQSVPNIGGGQGQGAARPVPRQQPQPQTQPLQASQPSQESPAQSDVFQIPRDSDSRPNTVAIDEDGNLEG